MPDCGVHYLWFAFVCILIRSPPPPQSSNTSLRPLSLSEAVWLLAIVPMSVAALIALWPLLTCQPAPKDSRLLVRTFSRSVSRSVVQLPPVVDDLNCPTFGHMVFSDSDSDGSNDAFLRRSFSETGGSDGKCDSSMAWIVLLLVFGALNSGVGGYFVYSLGTADV